MDVAPTLSAYFGVAGISLALTLTLVYLAVQERRLRGLAEVAAAHGLHTLRFVALAWESWLGAQHTLFAVQALNAAGSVLLVIGALRLAGKRPPLLLLAGLAAIAIALGGPAFWIFGGAAHCLLGWAFLRLSRDARYAGYVVAAVIALALGLLRATVPFWHLSPALVGYGLTLSGILYVACALALIIALQRTQFLAAHAASRCAQAIFDSTADLMAKVRVEPDGRLMVEMANPSLMAAHRASYPGHTLERHVGRDLREIMLHDFGLPPQEVARTAARYREVADSGVPLGLHKRVGERLYEAALTPLRDPDGRVRHVFYRGADVTELRRTEEKLRAGHQRFQAILDSAPVAIAITRRADREFVYVNPAWCEFMGCTREEVRGLSPAEIGLWDPPEREAAMLSVLDATGRVQLEMSFHNRRGRERHAVLSALAIELDGEPCVLGMSQDVSEAVLSRRRAGEMERHFERLFGSSPVPAIITRLTDGAILEANRALLESMRQEREAVLGLTTLEAGLWTDEAGRARLVARLREAGAVHGEPIRVCYAGEEREVLLSADTLDWKGEPAIVGFMLDVTDMRRASAEIERLNATLEERVRERTAEIEGFVYSVSHDLRAPLRAMSSFANLLGERPAVRLDRDAQGHAQRVSRAATRMGRMVDGLLRYAQLGRLTLGVQTVQLGAEARRLADELGRRDPRRRIAWRIGALPEVRGDPELLREALAALLENALKFAAARAETVVEVSARERDAAVEIEVRDNGIGFDMAYAEKLFAPFQRLHDEREFEGTGVGLALARRIVERHGGRIWCEAAPGEGAAFSFSLPR